MGEPFYLKPTPLPINRLWLPYQLINFVKYNILLNIVNCTVFRNKRYLFCLKKIFSAATAVRKTFWLMVFSTPCQVLLNNTFKKQMEVI
jgi:hypothetical protein